MELVVVEIAGSILRQSKFCDSNKNLGSAFLDIDVVWDLEKYNSKNKMFTNTTGNCTRKKKKNILTQRNLGDLPKTK